MWSVRVRCPVCEAAGDLVVDDDGAAAEMFDHRSGCQNRMSTDPGPYPGRP